MAVSVALPYHLYHRRSLNLGDIDPSYRMLLYICDRFELNQEQRYWLAFVYSLTYCGASTYYVYNEFPDFECVDLNRMENWWSPGGRERILCQTDRRWVRSNDLFVPAVEAWIRMIGGETQHEYFEHYTQSLQSPEARYERIYKRCSILPSFGQFSLFLLTEALHTITPLNLISTELDLNQAWSCRNGLCHAYQLPYVTDKNVLKIPSDGRQEILSAWQHLRETQPGTVWQFETTLCAYAKWEKGARWIGYYLDRQAVEIAKMEFRAPGVCWDVLWQYRAESYDSAYLVENNYSSKQLNKGIPSDWKFRQMARTRRVIEDQEKL